MFKSINKFVLIGFILVMSFFIIIGIFDLMVPEQNLRSQIGDGGFLSGNPCGAPCFWGISIGQTTEDDVWAVLQAKKISSECSKNIYENGESGIVCDIQGYVAFGFKEEREPVNSIQFVPGKTITIKDVIEKYGLPNLMVDLPCCTADMPLPNISLFYDDFNMELDLKAQESMYCDIKPTNIIVYITYRNHEEYTNRIKMFSDNSWVSYQGQWNGYGPCK